MRVPADEFKNWSIILDFKRNIKVTIKLDLGWDAALINIYMQLIIFITKDGKIIPCTVFLVHDDRNHLKPMLHLFQYWLEHLPVVPLGIAFVSQ